MINSLVVLFAAVGDSCSYANSSFLGFTTRWYQYLPGVENEQGQCVPSFTSLSDVWLIVAAVVEILLRLAAIVAIVMVIYGGVEFITSQGEPDKASKARSTIINGLIGLVIAVVAATVVTFIAGRFN